MGRGPLTPGDLTEEARFAWVAAAATAHRAGRLVSLEDVYRAAAAPEANVGESETAGPFARPDPATVDCLERACALASEDPREQIVRCRHLAEAASAVPIPKWVLAEIDRAEKNARRQHTR